MRHLRLRRDIDEASRLVSEAYAKDAETLERMFVQLACVGTHASKGLVEGQHHTVARPDVLPIPTTELGTGVRGSGHKRSPLGQGGNLWPAVDGEEGRLDFDFDYDVLRPVAVGAGKGDVGTFGVKVGVGVMVGVA